VKPGAAPVHRLELRLRELAQLFNSMDPAPFLEKDLDRDAEDYIASWAMQCPADSRFHITIHLQQMPAEADAGNLIAESIHNFFGYKAELAQRELTGLLRQGRTSLLIGLGFLALCLAAANAIAEYASGTFLVLGRESLTIAGWVAMWRPIQIFLYEWWPVNRRRRVYLQLSHAQVHVSEARPPRAPTEAKAAATGAAKKPPPPS